MNIRVILVANSLTGVYPVESQVKTPIKRYIIAFAFIALYMALYYFNQLLAGLGVIFANMIRTFLSSDQPGNTDLSNLYGEYLNEQSGLILAIGAVFSLLIYAAILALRNRNIIKHCKLNCAPHAKDIGMATLLGFSVNFILSLVLVILMAIPSFTRIFEEYEDHIAMLTSSNLLPAIIGIGILGPLVEEILFRGLITGELSALFSLPVTITVQGILFGIYHGNLVQGSYAAILGLLFGYCAYKSDNLYPAIAAHIAMNTTSLLLSLPAISDQLTNTMATLLYAVVSSVAFVFSLRFFIQKRKRSLQEPLSH